MGCVVLERGDAKEGFGSDDGAVLNVSAVLQGFVVLRGLNIILLRPKLELPYELAQRMQGGAAAFVQQNDVLRRQGWLAPGSNPDQLARPKKRGALRVSLPLSPLPSLPAGGTKQGFSAGRGRGFLIGRYPVP